MTKIRFSPSEKVSPPGEGSGSAGAIWIRRKGREKLKKPYPLLNLGVVSPAILIVATNQLLRHYPKS
jgi:hypothetical protein